MHTRCAAAIPAAPNQRQSLPRRQRCSPTNTHALYSRSLCAHARKSTHPWAGRPCSAIASISMHVCGVIPVIPIWHVLHACTGWPLAHARPATATMARLAVGRIDTHVHPASESVYATPHCCYGAAVSCRFTLRACALCVRPNWDPCCDVLPHCSHACSQVLNCAVLCCRASQLNRLLSHVCQPWGISLINPHPVDL